MQAGWQQPRNRWLDRKQAGWRRRQSLQQGQTKLSSLVAFFCCGAQQSAIWQHNIATQAARTSPINWRGLKHNTLQHLNPQLTAGLAKAGGGSCAKCATRRLSWSPKW